MFICLYLKHYEKFKIILLKILSELIRSLLVFITHPFLNFFFQVHKI